MEVEKLHGSFNKTRGSIRQKGTVTLSVPSSVLAMTALLRASLAKPVTHLSPPFFFNELRNRCVTSGGAGPMSKLLRFIPDCMFHMWMAPVEELAIPKLPHAETQTA
jgi:hypothetical protein